MVQHRLQHSRSVEEVLLASKLQKHQRTVLAAQHLPPESYVRSISTAAAGGASARQAKTRSRHSSSQRHTTSGAFRGTGSYSSMLRPLTGWSPPQSPGQQYSSGPAVDDEFSFDGQYSMLACVHGSCYSYHGSTFRR